MEQYYEKLYCQQIKEQIELQREIIELKKQRDDLGHVISSLEQENERLWGIIHDNNLTY